MTIKSLLLTGLLLMGMGRTNQAQAFSVNTVIAIACCWIVGFPTLFYVHEKAKSKANENQKDKLNKKRDILIDRINRTQAEYSNESLINGFRYFCSNSYAQHLDALPKQIQQWQTELRDIENKLNSLT